MIRGYRLEPLEHKSMSRAIRGCDKIRVSYPDTEAICPHSMPQWPR